MDLSALFAHMTNNSTDNSNVETFDPFQAPKAPKENPRVTSLREVHAYLDSLLLRGESHVSIPELQEKLAEMMAPRPKGRPRKQTF